MCCGSPLSGISGGIEGSILCIKEFFSALTHFLEERDKAEKNIPTAKANTELNYRNLKRSACDKAGAPFFCQKYVEWIRFPQ